MNPKTSYLDSTISYYNESADKLIPAYEMADMSELHSLLLSNLSPHSKIMDIGFGSGRDLSFLSNHGFDIWGIDPSQKFVDYAKQRFHSIPDHFFTTSLPNPNLPQNLLHCFDNIILIAVWMHLPKEIYKQSIQALCSLLKPYGKVILSYSITPRTEETERYFENVDSKMLQSHFKEHGFSLISITSNKDGLSEREITWVTEVYHYDKP